MTRDELTWLYPRIEPYTQQMLKVSDGHEIYVEESGNPRGKPVVFLHGGPGAGAGPDHRRFFDPRRYRIVILDQRGCGRSKPFGSLAHNDTAHLIQDLEAIRSKLGIDKWMVFGGSWGSTLALAYAQAHPAVVSELVLRGIFLGRKTELDWLYGGGAAQIFPEAWEKLTAVVEGMPGALITNYHKLLTCGDRAQETKAALALGAWENKVATLLPEKEGASKFADETYATAFSRIAAHYFVNGCFFSSEDQLLRGVEKIRNIPTVIVHGRYDMCCTISNAFDLKRAWPEAELFVVPDAGHAAFEPSLCRTLVAATDRFAWAR